MIVEETTQRGGAVETLESLEESFSPSPRKIVIITSGSSDFKEFQGFER